MLDPLEQFFGAYFHQDWADFSPSADHVIDEFLAEKRSPGDLRRLADLIAAQCRAHTDDAALNDSVLSLGCEYLPESDGLTMRQWLQHVEARLRAAAAAGA